MMFGTTALGSLAQRLGRVRATFLTFAGIGALAVAGASSSASADNVALPPAPNGNETSSQENSSQLNQLFFFENTNDKSARNEGYASGQFAYLKFQHSIEQYRFQAQAQYSFTDQLAVGGLIPLIHAHIPNNNNTGLGDILIYGQYKLDQIIPRNLVEMSAQVDAVIPTGKRSDFRDVGRFGVRPWLQAYKDFGQFGPGHFAAYGEMGFTITQDSDFRWGLAGTYEWNRIVGILEFYDQAGGKIGRPLVTITPGVAWRPGPFELAVGIPIGLNNGSPIWGVIIKATYAW